MDSKDLFDYIIKNLRKHFKLIKCDNNSPDNLDFIHFLKEKFRIRSDINCLIDNDLDGIIYLVDNSNTKIKTIKENINHYRIKNWGIIYDTGEGIKVFGHFYVTIVSLVKNTSEQIKNDENSIIKFIVRFPECYPSFFMGQYYPEKIIRKELIKIIKNVIIKTDIDSYFDMIDMKISFRNFLLLLREIAEKNRRQDLLPVIDHIIITDFDSLSPETKYNSKIFFDDVLSLFFLCIYKDTEPRIAKHYTEIVKIIMKNLDYFKNFVRINEL